MTALCRVSIETTAPPSARARTTGSTRRISSPGGSSAARREGAHDRLDAPDFFAGRQFGGPRTRRFAADIDEVGAGCDERAAVRDGALLVEPAPAVREAVGGNVEDTHDERPVEGKARPWLTRRRQPGKPVFGTRGKTGTSACQPAL